MTKVNLSPDCGNSPKNLFLQNVTIAFATGDAQTVLDAVADNVALEVIGTGVMQGKSDLAKTLRRLTSKKATEVTNLHVVSHGKAGAVNGLIKRHNGDVLSFANVYEFTGEKGDRLKKITSYQIETA